MRTAERYSQKKTSVKGKIPCHPPYLCFVPANRRAVGELKYRSIEIFNFPYS